MADDGGFRRFLLAFTGNWFTKMSGPLTVPFTIAAMFVPNFLAKLLLAALALACMVSASYAVWRRERLAYIAERDRNAMRPQILGEAYGFESRQRGYSRTSHEGENETGVFNATITFELMLVNHSPVVTNVRDVQLDGSRMKMPATFHPPGFDAALNRFRQAPEIVSPELRMGIAVAVTRRMDMEVSGTHSEHIERIDLAGLKVYVIDGFGGGHEIPVRPGEVLMF